MVLVVILFLDSEKKILKMLTKQWKCVLAFVIALHAYKKKQGDEARSDSKLGPILAWALWCFEEHMHAFIF